MYKTINKLEVRKILVKQGGLSGYYANAKTTVKKLLDMT